MALKKSSVVVNDLIEELNEENKRLLNELLFANKCLIVLNEFKSFVDLISIKIKLNLDSNELQMFETLYQKMWKVFSEKQNIFDCNSNEIFNNLSTNEKNYENLVIDSHLRNSSLDSGSEDKTEISLKRKKRKDITSQMKVITKVIKCEENCESIASKNSVKTESMNDLLNPLTNEKKSKPKNLFCHYPGCHTKSSTLARLRDHLNVHTGNRPHVCEECGKGFALKESLRVHTMGHQNKVKYYLCEYPGCQYKSVRAGILNDHMSVHTGIRPHECSDCDKTFKTIRGLQNHIEDIHKPSEQMFVCDIDGCNKEFKTEFSFRYHQKVNHLMEKKFVCDHPNCHFKTINRQRLSNHMATHSEDRPFICSVDGCDKRFKNNKSLESHSISHSTERPFECTHEGCHKRFKTGCDRNKHELCHSEKSHRCEWPGCEYTASRKSMLTSHALVHSQEYRFACEWTGCEKRFKSKNSLLDHKRIHMKDKRYACHWPGCHYRSTHAGNLNKHLRVHRNKDF